MFTTEYPNSNTSRAIPEWWIFATPLTQSCDIRLTALFPNPRITATLLYSPVPKEEVAPFLGRRCFSIQEQKQFPEPLLFRQRRYVPQERCMRWDRWKCSAAKACLHKPFDRRMLNPRDFYLSVEENCRNVLST